MRQLLSFGVAGQPGVVGPFTPARGATAAVVVAADAATSVSIPAAADGSVRDGTYAGQNFGLNPILEVKKVSPPGYTRESYLRFDLTGVGAAADITAAKLRLFGKLLNTAVPSRTIELYAVAGTGWGEVGLAWNNKPAAAATALAALTVTGTTGKAYEFDVTAYLKQQKAAGATAVAFALKGPTAGEGWAGFDSGEGTTPPALVVAHSVAPPAGFSARVNFQPSWAAVPGGYAADTGAVYGPRGNGLSYGWNAVAPFAVDRDLALSPDQRYDTFNYLQKTGAGGVWEIGVPNGTYQVRVVSGEALYTGSTARINVEGVLAVAAATTAAAHWVEGTTTVRVADGRLTLAPAAGAVNAKINFVDVTAVDAGGWTPLGPSADSRVVYVDNTPGGPGKDTNSGRSAAAPVATWAKGMSLLRSGYPDEVLVKRGTVQNTAILNWKLSGRDADEPLVIGSYGDPALARPKFVTGASLFGFTTGGAKIGHVVLSGIEFTPGRPDTTAARTTGFYAAGGTNDLLIEDCVFRAYQDNVVLAGTVDNPLTDVRVRRSQVVDAYGAGSSVAGQEYINRAQGLYADGVRGLVLEENVFDHNGWSEAVAGAGPNMYSQNIYLNVFNTGVRVVGNVIANASGHGLQARAGGVVDGNVFLANPFGMSFGYVNTSAALKGGVTGEVADNVFLGSRDVPWDAGEWALEVANTTPGLGASVRDNVIVGDTTGDKPAIRLRVPTDNANPGEDVGLNDVTVERNTVYGWTHSIATDASFVPGGTGHTGLTHLVVRNNDFQNNGINPLLAHDNVFDPAAETWAGNRYDAAGPADGWFALGTAQGAVGTGIDGWRSAVEPTTSAVRLPYVDSARTAGSYNATLGGAGTLAAFLAAVRQQSKANWRPPYTAGAVGDYVRAGFALAAAPPQG